MHLIRRCFILTRCVNAVGSKQTFRRPLTGKADSNLLRKGRSFKEQEKYLLE